MQSALLPLSLGDTVALLSIRANHSLSSFISVSIQGMGSGAERAYCALRLWGPSWALASTGHT